MDDTIDIAQVEVSRWGREGTRLNQFWGATYRVPGVCMTALMLMKDGCWTWCDAYDQCKFTSEQECRRVLETAKWVVGQPLSSAEGAD